mmetsp:Transcript_54447/g.129759  ORF Transcript_54447/g.129759 Transcript_54447/m.129759 type:complete len:97 (-) Transcript_54447:264-554(-)
MSTPCFSTVIRRQTFWTKSLTLNGHTSRELQEALLVATWASYRAWLLYTRCQDEPSKEDGEDLAIEGGSNLKPILIQAVGNPSHPNPQEHVGIHQQ